MKNKPRIMSSEKYEAIWRPCEHRWGTSCLDIYEFGDHGEPYFVQSLKFKTLKDAEAHFEEKYTHYDDIDCHPDYNAKTDKIEPS